MAVASQVFAVAGGTSFSLFFSFSLSPLQSLRSTLCGRRTKTDAFETSAEEAIPLLPFLFGLVGFVVGKNDPPPGRPLGLPFPPSPSPFSFFFLRLPPSSAADGGP